VADDTIDHGEIRKESHDLKPLLMTRWAETTGAAGKHKKPFLATVGTPNAGKSAARIAAVQIALHDFLDDRPEEAVFLLETAFLLAQEALEVMEQYPVEDGPLRKSRTIDARHGGNQASRNGPTSWR
jgi:hypothetical protein